MKMVEKVARTLAWLDWIHDPYMKDFPDIRIDTMYVDPKYFEEARAALEAMKEPTEEMISAGYTLCVGQDNMNDIYQAMIEAALEE